MLTQAFILFFSTISIFVFADDAPKFGERINLGLIEYGGINEASGIAASRKNADVLWIHNDSGGKNRISEFHGIAYLPFFFEA